MQNLQHPYEEIFGEIQILLAELSNSDSIENLVTKENQLNQIYQKFSFLKISNDFGFSSTADEALEIIDNEETNLDSDMISIEEFDNESKVAEIIVDETEIHDIFDEVPEVEEVHSFKEIDENEHYDEDLNQEANGIAEIASQENVVEEKFQSEEISVLEDDSVEEISGFSDIDSEEKELVEEVSNFAEIDSDDNQIEEEINSQETQIPETESINEVSSLTEIDSEENEVKEKFDSEEDEFVSEIQDNLLQDSSQKLEPMQDSQFSFAMNREDVQAPKEDDYKEKLAEKEAKLKELEENRRKIVELSRENNNFEKPKQDYETLNDEQHDKKFKLASIKGLKIAKSLFDDDHLEELEQHQPKQESGSLLKNNVPTDYMEAPKPKPEFKLDLNDRIAFSQHLFDGSQSELNQVVTVLNSFTSLDKAQEFLSDIYYERDWKKVDSYAQRLWTLVENRFL